MVTETIVRAAVPLPLREIELSPFDQVLQQLRLSYVLCFPLGSDADTVVIYEQLKQSLSITLAQMPILAGRVRVLDSSRMTVEIAIEEDAGARFESWDHSATLETIFADLHQGHYPHTIIERERFYPADFSPKDVIGHRVVIAKANFIRGGLLLYVSLSHVTCDGVSMDLMARKWAENTRNLGKVNIKEIEELPNQVLYRKRLTGNKSSSESQVAALGSISPSAGGDSASQTIVDEPFCSALLSVSVQHLTRLKEGVNQSTTNGERVSSIDILTALLARHLVLSSSTSPDELDRGTVDVGILRNVRNLIKPPISSSFIGNAALPQTISIPMGDILTTKEINPGEAIALHIRRELRNWQTHLPALIDHLASLPSFRVQTSMAQKVLIATDLSKTDLLSTYWGETLKEASAFRLLRASQKTVHTKVCFLPRKPGQQDFEIMLELPKSIHTGLRKDVEFSKYFTFKGDNKPDREFLLARL